MIEAVGNFLGPVYVLYAVLFRWRALRSRLGTFDLIFWVQAVFIAFWSSAYALDWLIWLGQRALWKLGL